MGRLSFIGSLKGLENHAIETFMRFRRIRAQSNSQSGRVWARAPVLKKFFAFAGDCYFSISRILFALPPPFLKFYEKLSILNSLN